MAVFEEDLYLGLESAASQIESSDAQVGPGLFQTPRYMEAVIRAVEADLAEDEIGRRINLRLARQEVLTSASSLLPPCGTRPTLNGAASPQPTTATSSDSGAP